MKHPEVIIGGIRYVPADTINKKIKEEIENRYMFILDISPSVVIDKQIELLERIISVVRDKDSRFNLICSPGFSKSAVAAFGIYRSFSATNIDTAISPIKHQDGNFNIQAALALTHTFPTNNLTTIIITDGFTY